MTDLERQDFERQLGLVRQEAIANAHVDIVGAGGIGSWTAMLLTRLGIGRLRVFDPDVVEPVNVPSQVYLPEQVGMPKVEALGALLPSREGQTRSLHATRWNGQPLSGIVISAVDSMEVRRRIWEHVKQEPVARRVPLLIDPRMGGTTGMIITVRPEVDRAFYEERWYSDERAVDLPCTARAVCFNTVGIAAVITSVVALHVSGSAPPREVWLGYGADLGLAVVSD